MVKFRKNLSAPGLLSSVRSAFERVKDWRQTSVQYPVSDVLMSGMAIFGMKYPSLLQFERDQCEETVRANLRNLYGIDRAPSDTRFREILDPIDPGKLRSAFKAVFASVQDGKALEQFRFIDGSYLVSVDGTGFFSSHEIHCNNCCVKKHKDGSLTYYHQMLGAVVVHPKLKQVIPLAPEPIMKQDGVTKNDCETNAAKRLLAALRRDHPFLSVTILGDGLFSNAPIIKLATRLKMGYIFTAKPGDHKALFDCFEAAKSLGASSTCAVEEQGHTHRFEFVNDLPLNDSNQDLVVNCLVYTETNKRTGKTIRFSWVTHMHLSEENVYDIMRGGRARWRIENETFNTLKNQGYQFEHNFGHGKVNLSTVLANLMMLAFLVDQTQELCCPAFQEALAKRGSKISLWRKIQALFIFFVVKDWADFWRRFLQGYRGFPNLNTS